MFRALALITLLVFSHRAAAAETDLNLVIAVDCSYSVDRQEYALQIAGIAQVFADPDIAAAIEQGPRGAIGVLIVQWSSRNTQIVTLPWTRLASREDVLDYAAAVAPQTRKTSDAGTAIASVLQFSNGQLMRAPFVASRSVIDIITDGKDNYRKPVRPVRDVIVAQGVTINALAVLNQVSNLHLYLGERVIGGDGAFVEEAASYEDFAGAFKRKLLREIGEPSVSQSPPLRGRCPEGTEGGRAQSAQHRCFGPPSALASLTHLPLKGGDWETDSLAHTTDSLLIQPRITQPTNKPTPAQTLTSRKN